MTNWEQVVADGFAVPAGLPVTELVTELLAMLGSPDPVVRDRQAYSTLATWIDRGVLAEDQLRALGNELVGRFGAPQIQARTFAPLVLDSIVTAGVFDPAWVPPFERWYVGEQDLRGYDEIWAGCTRSPTVVTCWEPSVWRPRWNPGGCWTWASSGCWRGRSTSSGTWRTIGSAPPSPPR